MYMLLYADSERQLSRPLSTCVNILWMLSESAALKCSVSCTIFPHRLKTKSGEMDQKLRLFGEAFYKKLHSRFYYSAVLLSAVIRVGKAHFWQKLTGNGLHLHSAVKIIEVPASSLPQWLMCFWSVNLLQDNNYFLWPQMLVEDLF